MLHALAKLRILRKILPSLRERLSLAGPYSSAGHCPASPSLFRRAMLGATRLWPTFRPPRGERPPGRSVDPWITMRVDTSSVIRLAEDRRMTASPRGEALAGALTCARSADQWSAILRSAELFVFRQALRGAPKECVFGGRRSVAPTAAWRASCVNSGMLFSGLYSVGKACYNLAVTR